VRGTAGGDQASVKSDGQNSGGWRSRSFCDREKSLRPLKLPQNDPHIPLHTTGPFSWGGPQSEKVGKSHSVGYSLLTIIEAIEKFVSTAPPRQKRDWAKPINGYSIETPGGKRKGTATLETLEDASEDQGTLDEGMLSLLLRANRC